MEMKRGRGKGEKQCKRTKESEREKRNCAYQGRLIIIKPPGQEFASLNSNRSEFQFIIQYITNGIYVGYTGLLIITSNNFIVPEIKDKSIKDIHF